ncbi:MAG: hypothetical protein MN733_11585 [Nitrososphaera sp.]|nr:hypothetical protein [Nitrososphaera sp.]
MATVKPGKSGEILCAVIIRYANGTATIETIVNPILKLVRSADVMGDLFSTTPPVVGPKPALTFNQI